MGIDRFIYRWRNELFAGVLSGLLLAFSFPPYPARFLSCIALVPVFRFFITPTDSAADRRGVIRMGLVTGFAFGLSFFTLLLFWIVNLIPASSVKIPWILTPALILLVLYLSCYPALSFIAIHFLRKRYGGVALLGVPAVWSVFELARSSGELGFSWGIVSNSLVTYPMAIQGASVYGPYGLSFVVVLVNMLLALVLFGRGKGNRILALAGLVFVTCAHLGFGHYRINSYDRKMNEGNGLMKVAVVQPNVDLAIKWNPAYRDSIFSKIEILTLKSAANGAEVVIFPETSAPISLSYSPEYGERLEMLSRTSGVDLLVGYIYHTSINNSIQSYNSAGMFDSSGRLITQYHKVNLLPFGERIPFSQYIPALSRLKFGQANFEAGTLQPLFRSKAGPFGVLICFESTFSDFARRYVRDGADFLVNITNDGWFGSERGPLQHTETAVLRSVENGVPLLRSANTGISMIVDPLGRVERHIGLDREGLLLADIGRPLRRTPYCKYGNLIFYIMVLSSLAAVPLGQAIRRCGRKVRLR